jgi:hypothetical protein
MESKNLIRYRHNAHKHRLFVTLSRHSNIVRCINKNCHRVVAKSEAFFWCPKCDWDLCQFCYETPVIQGKEVELNSSDEDIDSTINWNNKRYREYRSEVDPSLCRSESSESSDCEDTQN